mmetsp:Transcript_21451/g.31896  ORF Transcript_21451/g.31896 Transcript_21451/m.31896 type:complete len:621 (+) Transcript_21451:57-1919(+)|eukprot:CAMPEP_0167747174 /NCGR_PEP_ID=MMETSP0110_2-20121227/4136_1 /TAXON_ID=629695 /ORGANISM="Gymnochlora sp., Strain CCMP2014" /LENGTH=620 /DNA_ID=CAMNT_0007632049 /DNA_START=40 /DNA_END=1902 /DNA_ORIENTATION=+
MLSFLFGEDEPAPAVAAPAKEDAKKNGAEAPKAQEFPEYTHSLMVFGFAMGKNRDINGEYRMTGQWFERRPVYALVGKEAVMHIWYSDGWCIGPRQYLGTSVAMAHNEYKGQRVWLTDKPWKVQVQKSIRVEPNIKVIPQMSVMVIGADGTQKVLNGRYQLRHDLVKLPKEIRDRFCDRPVYKQVPKAYSEGKKEKAAGPYCIWCCDQGWCIGLESDLGTLLCYAACDDSSTVPWLVKFPWKIVRSGSNKPYWTDSSNLLVVACAEAYISGCNVSNGAWNGLYVMREDLVALPFFSKKTFRGRPVYQHKDGKQCIWFSELGWCVGLQRDIGTTRCGIYNKSKAAVPWLCDQPWQVLENKQFSACASLRVVPVCTDQTVKERDDRLAAQAIEKKNAESKGAEAVKSSETKAKSDSKQESKFDSEMQSLKKKKMDLETDARDLCERFMKMSLDVGLSTSAAEDKLKEAEQVAGETLSRREELLPSLAPLLQKLVLKQVAIQEVESEMSKLEMENEGKGSQTSPAISEGPKRTESVSDDTNAQNGGNLPELPENMVKGLSDEIKRQIAEAERKLEESNSGDFLDSLNPLPVLRDIPLFGDLVSLVAPEQTVNSVHAFEPGRFG